MSSPPGGSAGADAPSAPSRGRGRGKSRGGLGKYLRARGRGHRGGGRPAEFSRRLVLEGEQPGDEEEEEEAERERRAKYGKRQLESNAHRYEEEEPELGSDGEPIVEPEVDLSFFLARQRLDDDATPGPSAAPPPDPDALADVDQSLAHLLPAGSLSAGANTRKGKVRQIEWDRDLEQMKREKDVADANRDLKERFRARAAKQQSKPVFPTRTSAHGKLAASNAVVEAPPLPTDADKPKPQVGQKEEMEDFLDDLLG